MRKKNEIHCTARTESKPAGREWATTTGQDRTRSFEALRRKHWLHTSEEARRVYPWGVELGRGTAVPTVPTQTVSSSVVACRPDTGQFSAANLVSLRSWEAVLLSVRQVKMSRIRIRPTAQPSIFESFAQAAKRRTTLREASDDQPNVVVVVDDDPSFDITEVGWLPQMLENAFLLLSPDSSLLVEIFCRICSLSMKDVCSTGIWYYPMIFLCIVFEIFRGFTKTSCSDEIYFISHVCCSCFIVGEDDSGRRGSVRGRQCHHHALRYTIMTMHGIQIHVVMYIIMSHTLNTSTEPSWYVYAHRGS